MKLWITFVMALFMAACSFATVTQQNYTNAYCSGAYRPAVYIDFETGNVSQTLNANMDLFIWNVLCDYLSTENEATVGRVIGNFDADCTNVPRYNMSYSHELGQIWDAPYQNNSLWCVKTAEGNKAIFRITEINITPPYNNTFNGTSYVQDTGSFIFPFTVQHALYSSYAYSSLYNGVYLAPFIDIDTGIQAFGNDSIYDMGINMNYLTSTYCIYAKNTAKIAKVFGSTNCYSVMPGAYYTTANGTCPITGWDNSSTLCVISTANRLYRFKLQEYNANYNMPSTAYSQPETVPLSIGGELNASGMAALYFNLQYSKAETSFFTGADFYYNFSAQTLNALNTTTYNFYGSESTPSNTLQSVSCKNIPTFWVGNETASGGLNYPLGTYDIYCFNLSIEQGSELYGAIKLVTANSTRLDMQYLIYGNHYNAWHVLSQTPLQAQANSPVHLVYTTTILMTTQIKVRYYDSRFASWSSFVYLNDLNSYNTTHTITIPAADIPAAANYEIWFTGIDSSNYTYYSTVNEKYNFTALGGANSVFANETTWVLYPQMPNGLPLSSASCSVELYNSYDNKSSMSPYTGMSYINIPTGNASLNPLSVWFLSVNINPVDLNRNHNYTCSAEGYNTTSGTAYIAYVPYFTTVIMASQPKCWQTFTATSRMSCEMTMNASNTPAWYCKYDANGCKTTQNSICIEYGTYNGYQCDSASAIPAGFPVNGTAETGTQPGNGTGSGQISNWVGDWIGLIFGISAASALIFLACMIIGNLLIGAGVYIRSGASVMLGSMFDSIGFWALGWLPVWVPIILGVIASFLIAKFIAGSVQPQGSG